MSAILYIVQLVFTLLYIPVLLYGNSCMLLKSLCTNGHKPSSNSLVSAMVENEDFSIHDTLLAATLFRMIHLLKH